MKKWTDEALQRLVEQEMKGWPLSEEGLLAEDASPSVNTVSGEDADLYRALFKAMSAQPAAHSSDIGDAVVNIIARRQDKRDHIFSIILGAAGISMVILLGIIALLTVNASLMNQLFLTLADAKYIMLFMLVVAFCAWGIDWLGEKRIAVH